MSWDLPLLELVRGLAARCDRDDRATDTLTLSGTAIDELKATVSALERRGATPKLIVDGMPVTADEVLPQDSWALTIAKSSLALALGFKPQQNEQVALFLSPEALDSWARRQLTLEEGYRWPDRLTILVDGLSGSVFGPKIRCSPLGEDLPPFDQQSSAVNQQVVSALVLLPAEALTRRVGQSLLTGGDLDGAQTACMRLWAERDASQLLCDEVTHRQGGYQVILRGGRRVTMDLAVPSEPPTRQELELVQSAVAWCFAEHRDARHALLVDRLALDAVEGDAFLPFLRSNLNAALQDSRDRYRLVVIEKKDAAVKETRDILKDVRTQADAYASKVRDLTSTFLRDLLAALLLIGLGLLGRMNSDSLAQVVDAAPVNVFFKILAAYFVLSAALQIATHWRDLYLTTLELDRWWRLTRTSLAGKDVKRVMAEVIRPRRRTFCVAVIAIAVLNALIAGALWNWKTLFESVLPGT